MDDATNRGANVGDGCSGGRTSCPSRSLVGRG